MTFRSILRVCLAVACALAIASAAPSAALAQAVPAPIKPAAALPPDVAYARFIALIRAHLSTGDDLVAAKQWQAAARHFGFPREEIYGVIRDDLATYRTPPFEYWLKTLVQAARAGHVKQYRQARQKIDAALDAADTALKARQADWARFTTKVAVEVLKSAPDEYEDAVEKGRIVRPIGYQTARGIIGQAANMLTAASAGLNGSAGEVLSGMQSDLAHMRQAFAPVLAPKQPAMEPAAMRDILSKIEAAAAKLG